MRYAEYWQAGKVQWQKTPGYIRAIGAYALITAATIVFHGNPSISWWAGFAAAGFVAGSFAVKAFHQDLLSRYSHLAWHRRDKREAFISAAKEALFIGLFCFFLGLSGLVALPDRLPLGASAIEYGAYYAVLGVAIGCGLGLLGSILVSQE